MEKWEQAILKESATLHQAIRNLNEVALQLILVVDKEGHLIGTISDGDIRRALIKELDFTSKISLIMNKNPLVVPKGFSNSDIYQLMQLNQVRQIPIIDENNVPIGLHLWDSFASPIKRNNTFVVMAGGQGKRLRPYTENCPKPMLKIEGKPILEHIIDRAKSEGFYNFIISVNYLSEIIKDYFGDGSRHKVNIKYIHEDTPLGTAGSLS